MAERPVTVVLMASDGTAVRAPGWLQEFSPAIRLRRAAAVMLIAFALAATLIPIPIIHLLGIPLVLVFGVVLTVRQLAAVARLRPLTMACPRCGAPNRVGGGLGYRHIDAPIARKCEDCRRSLTLQITGPESGRGGD